MALKNEDPQNQLSIKFKTLMTPSKIGRMQASDVDFENEASIVMKMFKMRTIILIPIQIFASVVLENQTEKGKSVFKRMKIADTSSLAPCEAPLRFSFSFNLK